MLSELKIRKMVVFILPSHIPSLMPFLILCRRTFLTLLFPFSSKNSFNIPWKLYPLQDSLSIFVCLRNSLFLLHFGRIGSWGAEFSVGGQFPPKLMTPHSVLTCGARSSASRCFYPTASDGRSLSASLAAV